MKQIKQFILNIINAQSNYKKALRRGELLEEAYVEICTLRDDIKHLLRVYRKGTGFKRGYVKDKDTAIEFVNFLKMIRESLHDMYLDNKGDFSIQRKLFEANQIIEYVKMIHKLD